MKEKIYIGSYSDNIKICELDDSKLKIINEIKTTMNPSYLQINNGFLYAVSEQEVGAISSFEIDKNNVKILNVKKINQSLPCYITTNSNRDKLLVANYESGSIIVYQIKKNGSIGRRKGIKKYNNSNMHFAEFIGDNIYAIDLGKDAIYIYNLKMQLISQIDMNRNCGPRHMVMSKDENIMYVVTELSNQILVYKKNDNKFDLIQEISTLPDESIESYAGAIRISRDNKNIYVTNRGHNSISVFSILKRGLKFVQNIPSYGEFPRDILLNESEEYAIVANQKSNNVIVYKRNIKNGILSKIDGEVKMEKPSCIVRSKYEI